MSDGRALKIGIMFANSGPLAVPDVAAAMAEAADAAGIESLWAVEHVVIPKGYQSQYPYNASGRAPAAESSDIPDPLIWLAFVAARTTRIKLATGILILNQRQPLVVAKEIATLDQLSRGRVVLGVGSGWLKEEFDALGVPFDDRGDRLDDHIAALRAVWRDGRDGASHASRFTVFDECISRPVPPAGSVPIVIGGHTKRAARRAGELGDGFFPGKGSPAELAELVELMRAHATKAGRDPDAIELTTFIRNRDDTQRLIDIGFTRFTIPPPTYDIDAFEPAMRQAMERADATLS